MKFIKFVTYNARGLRQSSKRRQVFAFMHVQKFDVIFLQETHSATCDENYWRNEWGGKMFFSHGSMRSKGVCILFNPSLHVQMVRTECHVDGRYVILDITIAGCTFTLVCLYGPNLDQPLFFNNFIHLLNTFHCQNIIFGGDFNFVFNLNLDTHHELYN